MTSSGTRPRIAVFSGATATIQNSEPLVTSNKARAKCGLPLKTNPDGTPLRFDALRAQRLAAPVTVYIEQFSAHPLERDASDLYGAPDGYLDREGQFHQQRQSPDDVPVFEVTLYPDDGLYPLPYMARQANGQPWDGDCAVPLGQDCRQPHYPDASRIFEEIDRLGVGDTGWSSLLSSRANFDFYRAAPAAGYTQGLPQALRTDVGEGDIAPEQRGRDFFPYRPRHLKAEPPAPMLARLTNKVQRAMATGQYVGGIWLEGTPHVEETTYWLNLLIDTTLPIAGNSSQRAHGAVGNDGDRNIIDSVEYILSRIWAGPDGRDMVGVVVIMDEQVFTAREVQKADARPGGYVATGGHGGIVGTIGEPGPPVLTFRPVRRHTYTSAVNLTRLPDGVQGVQRAGERVTWIDVRVKDGNGDLMPTAIPKVTICKDGRYITDSGEDDASSQTDLLARIEQNLREAPLAGFVAEAGVPYGSMNRAVDTALRRAALCGMPVVKVSRGNAEGFVPRNPLELTISGNNLTANKARLLLMACLLRFGSLPPAADPERPTEEEIRAIRARLEEYQEVFDTH